MFSREEGAARLRGGRGRFVTAATVALLIGSACASAVVASCGSAWAADGRAFELVSPADKNGGDIPGDGVSVAAAANGDAIAYTSRASFGDTVGAGPAGQTMYVARRGIGGWQSHGVTPTPSSAAYVSLGIPLVIDFSTDMRSAVVWADDLSGVQGALPTPNIYAENTESRALSLVTQPLAGPQSTTAMVIDYVIQGGAAGVSDDSRHIAFTGSASQLLPEAPVGVPSVYEWADGTLRLASVLPDGSIATNGAVLASPNTTVRQTYRQTVSRDGSRVMFLSPSGSSDAQLYERVDHARTVWVSQPETSGPSLTPQNVSLQQVTGDSRHVIFTTTSRLLDSDTNDGPDIYLYTDSPDPARDANLTLVTNTGDVPGLLDDGTSAVIGSSDDGRRIYYFKNGEILTWHNGETRGVANNVILDPSPALGFAATASTPGAARVTQDGRYMAFMARGPVESAGANPLIGDGGSRNELYLYDAVTDQLRCVSCPSAGTATADSSVIPSVTNIAPSNNVAGSRPSFLAADGRVFFSTTQALVPQDVNGVLDVYEFEPEPATGGVKLISTGTGSDAAGFVGASSSGNDVFLVTRQQLVKADRDGYVDLYDARVGGGFPDLPAPGEPCVGDACQGGSTPAPGDVTSGSLTFEGDGGQSTGAGRLRVVGVRVAGAHATLRVASPSAGGLSWAGSDMRRGSRHLAKAGTYSIRVTLTPRGRRQLERYRVVHLRLRLALRLPGRVRTTAAAFLTFKSSKKGR